MIKDVFFDLGGTLYTYKNVPRATAPLLDTAIKKVTLPQPSRRLKKSTCMPQARPSSAMQIRPTICMSHFFYQCSSHSSNNSVGS